jgi:hypothetical protein
VSEVLARPEPAEVADPRAWWTGRLSMSIACLLAGQMDNADLRKAYREFLRSPACSPELQALLRDTFR